MIPEAWKWKTTLSSHVNGFFQSLVSISLGLVLLRCDVLSSKWLQANTQASCRLWWWRGFSISWPRRCGVQFQCRCSNLQTLHNHSTPWTGHFEHVLGLIIFFRIVSFKVNAVPGSLVFFKPGGLGAVLAGSIHTVDEQVLNFKVPVPVQVTRVKTRTQ